MAAIQAWMIPSWPKCEWYLPLDPACWPSFVHISTQISADDDPLGRQRGETVWMADIDGRSFYVGWEWVELRPGLVVLSDPNSIVSNGVMDGVERPLNRLAHLLPWRDTVCAALKAMREAPRMLLGHASFGPRALAA